MRRPTAALVLALACAAGPMRAQVGGTIAGRVVDAATREPLAGARVTLDRLQRASVTDSAGLFRLLEVPAGWVRLRTFLVGYRPAIRESVLVRAGETRTLEIALVVRVDTLPALDVTTLPDLVLDPLVTATVQRITGAELRRLPVSTLEEAVTLSAGAVGTSYRGGRIGQESFILDGLPVKNQLDASTGGLGLRFPPDLLTEAALVTNGFSARYGQALSGLVNVVTKDGGDAWSGRVAYESDRALPAGWDYGLDRLVVAGDGPLAGPARVAFAADIAGRLDAEPVNAPPPADPRDPRAAAPSLLPHNSGESYDVGAKLMLPLGGGHVLRLFGLGSLEQRLLYDPVLKYDLAYAPGRRVAASLASLHWQWAPAARAARSFLADLRLAFFDRDFVRGQLASTPPYRVGAFTGSRFRVVGEEFARAQDTVATRQAVPGHTLPDWSASTPWGVPAFFLGSGGRGDLAWNHFSELRAQLDLTIGGREADLSLGGEVVRQHVRTFQRVLAYLPSGDSIPHPTAADFSPVNAAAYMESRVRWSDLAFTIGLRGDRFDPRTTVGGRQTRARVALSPRLAVSTVLRGATVVVSYGRFAQAPDFQYLVDAAFDDTVRTGRFRAGNPALGHETATQYEFSLRTRPRPGLALRLNAYIKLLDGLVASVPFGLDPDSTIFGNTDYGDVMGAELLLEREFADGWGVRVLYSIQRAQATATDAFRIFQFITVNSLGDTVIPGRVTFPLDYDRRHGLTVVGQWRVDDLAGPRWRGIAPVAGLEGSVIVRAGSGLPYTRTNATGDSLVGLPNSSRLPWQLTLDALVRRTFSLGGVRAAAYLDVRNLLSRRNVVAVRRDTGAPALGPAEIAAEAARAQAEHPEAIPYESPRYRAWADTDGNGRIEGAELGTLFYAAARDFYQPLFAYGAPRLVRLGVEVIF